VVFNHGGAAHEKGPKGAINYGFSCQYSKQYS